jgi:hypothetical protein
MRATILITLLLANPSEPLDVRTAAGESQTGADGGRQRF